MSLKLSGIYKEGVLCADSSAEIEIEDKKGASNKDALWINCLINALA